MIQSLHRLFYFEIDQILFAIPVSDFLPDSICAASRSFCQK